MTQIGKCDTCRQRKVKCDEERPKCGACRKKDRPCTYSYGQASAFVVQDPNQLTKHGRSKIDPVVHTMDSPVEFAITTSIGQSDLRTTTERQAENGRGFFSTLAPISKARTRPSKKKEAYQRKILESYLQHLQQESAMNSIRPSSHESTLIARYINMLGSSSLEKQPLSILGTWIQSIPSRIGSSRMLDLATEFVINSHAVYFDDTYSKRKLARATKAKALRELQLVMLSTLNKPTYDVVLATKMHYAAEALLGVGTMYHAIHAFGLAELLKSGVVADIDHEHCWNLIDNTYADDVNEALLAGRKSVYDNEFYLSSTYPQALDSRVLSASQRASMAIMHVFIQCPRLVALVRRAVTNPDDATSLASAVSLAESLWQVDLPGQVDEHMKLSITVNPTPVDSNMEDIFSDSLEFDSIQSMNLCTRYWILRVVLAGLADTLWRHFPVEYSLSLLPSQEVLRSIDVDCALKMAKSLKWSESISAKLPLVPLRLHSALQVSIGPWNRIIRNSTVFSPDVASSTSPDADFEISRAKRMKAWLFAECNRIHAPWHVFDVEEKPLLEALDAMAGEKIPEWLPVRIRFEAEDGEMVIKLDYENPSGGHQERYQLGEEPPKKMWDVMDDGRQKSMDMNVQELPHRPATSSSPADQLTANDSNAVVSRSQATNMRPVDRFYSTGRNICSISGTWQDTSNTVTLPLDSEHSISEFAQPYNMQTASNPDSFTGHIGSHEYGESSYWPQNSTDSSRILELPSTHPSFPALGSESATRNDNVDYNENFSTF